MSLEFNNFLDAYNISYESLSAVHGEEFTEDNAYQILLNDESIQSLKDAVKEEADYNKDQVEMNQNLLRMKKLLAKAKLEETLSIEYQKNQIEL